MSEGRRKNVESGNQDLLRGSTRLHGLADDRTRIYGSGAEQDEEEKKMSEAVIVIVLAAFLFGMIMGLALGKANK